MEVLAVLGFLFSPEHLAAAGNGVGAMGFVFLLVLSAAALLHVGTAMALVAPLPSRKHIRLSAAKVASRLMLFAVFGTLLLGTAGYLFNEVFVHSFPNMLFSFVMLASCAAIHLALPFAARRALMSLLGAAALGGLIFLSIMSWFPHAPDAAAPAPSGQPMLLLLALPLLAGFDLAERGGLKAMLLTLAAMVVMHWLWGMAELQVVARERLALSTVPHMNAVRRILGDDGRLVMGASMIVGSTAGLLLLLEGLASSWKDLRPACGQWERRVTGAIFLLLPAVLLGTGWAGEPVTESWLRGCVAGMFGMYGLACLQGLSEKGGSIWGVAGLLASTGSLVVVLLSSDNLVAAAGSLLLTCALAVIVYYIAVKSEDS